MTEDYLVVLEVRYRGGDLGAAKVEELVDALLDVAAADPELTEPDVAASLRDGTLDIQMVVTAPDQAQASVKALAAVRTAIGAVGDEMPAGAGWEPTRGLLRVAPVAAAQRILAGA